MENYDIIIAGGGPAGIAAGFTAATLGLKIAIVEKSSMLGGNWTNGYVLSILGIYTYNGSIKIVGGIADEVITKLTDYGGTKGKRGNFIPFRPDEMKIVLGTIAESYKDKITIYFNSLVKGANLEGTKIKSIKIVGKNSSYNISAKMFIDATGDADLSYYAGVQILSGMKDTGIHQDASIPFRIGNVNEKKVLDFALSNPELIKVKFNVYKLERIYVMSKLVKKAKTKGALYLPHLNAGLLLFNTSVEGEFVCNATHVSINNFASGKELAKAIADARKQITSTLNFFVREIPGFENAHLIDSAPSIGFRETRRAVGEYILKKGDILNNRRFNDAIAKCGHPIEIHHPIKGIVYQHLKGGDNSWYHIPYRSIVAKGIGNLFIIGRCLSAEFEAQASARVTGAALAMGQAAATAAMLAIKDGVNAKDVNVKVLQNILKTHGAII